MQKISSKLELPEFARKRRWTLGRENADNAIQLFKGHREQKSATNVLKMNRNKVKQSKYKI